MNTAEALAPDVSEEVGEQAGRVRVLRADAFASPDLREQLRPFLQAGLDADVFGGLTPDGLMDAAAQERMVVVVLDNGLAYAVATLELVEALDGQRTLHVVTLSGDGLEQWLPALHSIGERLGVEQGCTSMTLTGRPGWQRVMARHGWSTEQVTMRRPIQ